MAPHFGDGDWRSIAEQASKEMDPVKLIVLVRELCRLLEAKRRESSQLQRVS